MKQVSITELRKNLSKYVKGNDIIEITKYGKPVAYLVPISLYKKLGE